MPVARNAVARRMRAYRRRRAAGEIVLAVKVQEITLIEKLIEGRLLPERDAEDRRKLTAALEKVIAAL